MESDIPLIEIAGEDDSLLQQFADSNETPSKSSVSYFACSPIALPPLHTKSIKNCVHGEKPSSSSSEGSNNKENINSNNVEVLKLGMEPMQMKRRKKGGGYNLRQSLAWDKAFFTDEGILDPTELTLITGISGNKFGGRLATISEEGNSSFSSDTICTNESEEDLHKKLPDKSRTLKGNSEKAGSAGHRDSLPHHKVTQKVLSVHHTNRAESKVGGCPGPLVASSLKRPANYNTMKTTKKESKLPKLPISKPGPCFSATTKGSMTASQSRHNLIPKTTINGQKNVGSKSSVKNVQGSQSRAKTGLGSHPLPAKDPAQKTVRNLTNLSSKATSSTKSRSVHVHIANSGSEMIPDRLLYCETQAGSVPYATKNLAQHAGANLNDSLPEAARSTSLGPSHIHRASSGLMLSDRLHPCENQELPATLAASHHKNVCNTGAQPPNIEPARPSGLRMPSQSLRFFDPRTSLESGSWQQKKVQQYNNNMDSSRKIGELRPPTVPARTPMKSNDITESVCSAPSTLSANYGSTQLSPSPIYLGNTTNSVSDSNINPNLERRIVQKVDIKEQYEGRGSELEAQEVIEQEKKILRREENMEMEKIARKGDEEVKVSNNQELLESHPAEQLGEVNGANIHLDGNAGYNNDGVGTHQLMPQGSDERVVLIPGTEDKFLLHTHSGEDGLQNNTAISTSTWGQFIWHQEQNISTVVDSGRNFLLDLAQTSRGQAGTAKSDAPKVNPESHLDASSLDAVDQVSKVFGESKKDGTGKKRDNLRAPKSLNPGLENYHVLLKREKIEQENDVAKGDEFYKILPMKDDARCHTDSLCNETKAEISITCGESLKDEDGKGGNNVAGTLEGCSNGPETSYSQFQSENQTLKGTSSAGNSPKTHVEDAEVQLLDGDILGGSCVRLTSIIHDQSIKVVDYSDIFEEQPEFCNTNMEVERVVPKNDNLLLTSTEEMQQVWASKTLRNVVDVNDVYECDPKPYNSISHAAPVGKEVGFHHDDNGELCIECGTSVSKVVESITEHYENHTNRQMTHNTECCDLVHLTELVSSGKGEMVGSKTTCMEYCSTGEKSCSFPRKVDGSRISFSEEVETEVLQERNTPMVGEFQHELDGGSGLKKKNDATMLIKRSNSIKRQDNSLVIHPPDSVPFSDEWLVAIEAAGEEKEKIAQKGDAEVKGSDNQELLESHPTEQLGEGNGASIHFNTEPQDQSIQIVDHSDIFEEQPEFSNTGIKVEQVSENSHQSLINTEHIQQECVCKAVRNAVDLNDVSECDPKPSNTIAHAAPVRQEVGFPSDDAGELCLEYGTLGSTVGDSVNEHNENYTDRQLTHNTELVGANTTCIESCSAGDESCSFQEKVAGSMLEEKPTMYGAYVDTGRVLADNSQVCMKDSLSPEKIANLEELNNVLDSVIVVPEQSISHGCDLQSTSAGAQILPRVRGNVSDLNGDDQPYMDNEPQGSTGIMSSTESYEYLTNEQSGYGLESTGQDPSEFNSDFWMSRHLTTGVKVSFGEDIETEVLQERNTPLVGEFLHELDGGSGLKKNNDAAMLIKCSNNIKGQDSSLVIHLPDAVPFSDEGLATIEAAGEDLAQTSGDQVDTAKPDASKVNPESHLDVSSLDAKDRVSKVFGESKKDGIGKRGDNLSALKSLDPGLENCHVLQQRVKIKQENNVAKGVEEFYKRLPTVQGCSSGSKTSHSRFQSENQTLQGTDSTGNFLKTHVEDARVQLLDWDILVESCIRVAHNQSIQIVDHSNIFEERPNFSNAGMKVERVSESNHQLLINKECISKTVRNGVDVNDVYDCGPKPSNAIAHAAPVGQEVGFHCDNDGELHIEYGTSGSTVVESMAEHNENYTDRQLTHNTELVGANTTCMEYCSAGEESCSFPRKVDGSRISFGEEVEAEVLQERNCPMVGEFRDELDVGSGLKKNNDATILIKRSNSIKRQDNSLVIHPSDAVPFSDEWLAAIEAAGEEILTMKCGAVQHSPPDKSLPEPGPWSPVKKKSNQIGPYDCTKYTKAMPPNSQ